MLFLKRDFFTAEWKNNLHISYVLPYREKIISNESTSPFHNLFEYFPTKEKVLVRWIKYSCGLFYSYNFNIECNHVLLILVNILFITRHLANEV